MGFATTLRIIVAYSLVFIPSCKERTQRSQLLEVPTTANGEVDYETWYKAVEMEAERDQRTKGIMGEYTQDVFKEAMKGQESTAWLINPKNSKSKRKYVSPLQKKEDGEEVFLEVAQDNPYLFQIEMRKVNGRRLGYVSTTVFVEKDGQLRKQDGAVFSMRMGLTNEQQMEAEMNSITTRMASFNARYVNAHLAQNALKLTGDEPTLFQKFQIFFGVLAFGFCLFMIQIMSNPSAAHIRKTALIFVGVAFVAIVAGLLIKEGQKVLNRKIKSRLDELGI